MTGSQAYVYDTGHTVECIATSPITHHASLFLYPDGAAVQQLDGFGFEDDDFTASGFDNALLAQLTQSANGRFRCGAGKFSQFSACELQGGAELFIKRV